MKLIFIAIFFLSLNSFSQKVLDLTYHNFIGKEKTFQFFNHREFSYKLKGHLFCKTKTIANMGDSTIVFTDGTIIKISRIKGIKIKGAGVSKYFFGAAFLFPMLDVANNAIFNRTPIVNERAFRIGGIILAAGLIVNYIQDKHIHIRKNSTFRVFDPDYEHLNAKR